MQLLGLPPPENNYYDLNQRYRLQPELIFVFGSNLAGRHGAGAASLAYEQYGAIYGKGIGHYGRSYAIPTKDRNIITLPIRSIDFYVKRFIQYTQESNLFFYVTPIGTGLAGLKHEQVAPLFKGCQNCWLPDVWKEFIEE